LLSVQFIRLKDGVLANAVMWVLWFGRTPRKALASPNIRPRLAAGARRVKRKQWRIIGREPVFIFLSRLIGHDPPHGKP
jgi:hypothetical protein